MKSILEDIKNQEFKQVYLFYGEEGYLKKQYRDKLAGALNPDKDHAVFCGQEGDSSGKYRVFQGAVPGTGRLYEQSPGVSVYDLCGRRGG